MNNYKEIEMEEKKISFELWWMMANKKMQLPEYLKEVIKVDFKARGANSEETESKYKECLRLFGYDY